MDGAFYARPHPFYQLFSIHAFVRHEDKLKQILLFHVFMSNRTTQDYKAVLQKVKEILLTPLDEEDAPPDELGISEVLCDFEKALFKAVRQVFVGFDFLIDVVLDENEKPKVVIFGCAFHWAQAVFRKIANLGLGIEYRLACFFSF